MSLPPLPFLLPLYCSVLSGEADRPHSKGRPRRPFLTRLSVTPLPQSTRAPFHLQRTPHPPAHTTPPQCIASAPLYLASLSQRTSHPSFGRQREKEDRKVEMRTESRERPVEGVRQQGMAAIPPRFPRGWRKIWLCVLTTACCQGFCVCLFSAPVPTGRPALHLQVGD